MSASSRIESRIAGAAIFIASALFALGLAEFGARTYLAKFASDKDRKRYGTLSQVQAYVGHWGETSTRKSDLLLQNHPHLGYFGSPGYDTAPNRHNALGFRGEEIPREKAPGEIRIACLGGSTTYGAFVDDYTGSYPYLLEKKLRAEGHNVRVINAGLHGYASLQSLINLQSRVLDLQPDLLVYYESVNDLELRMVWPPSEYRGDLGRIEPTPMAQVPDLLQYSTLYRYLKIKLGFADSQSALFGKQQLRAGFYNQEFLTQHYGKTYPTGIFSTVPASKILEVNKPIFYRRNLESIAAIGKARGIPTLLVTFTHSPDFKENPQAWTPEYESGIAEQNAVMAEVAAKSGTLFYDMAAVYPAHDKSLFTEGIHFTREGNSKIAELVGGYLEPVLSQRSKR